MAYVFTNNAVPADTAVVPEYEVQSVSNVQALKIKRLISVVNGTEVANSSLKGQFVGRSRLYTAAEVAASGFDANLLLNVEYLISDVDRDKIADDAVGTDQIADDAVTAAKLAANVVVAAAIADGAVTTAKIADANVTHAKLADDAVEEDNIKDGAVTTDKIGDTQVTGGKIALGGVDTNQLAADAVDGSKIEDDAVDSEHITDGAVDLAHLSASGTASSTTFLRGDNSWATIDQLADGSVTTAKLANDAVTGVKVASGAIGQSALASNAVTNAKVADDAIGVAELNIDNSHSGSKVLGANAEGNLSWVDPVVGDGDITTAKLADDAVTQAKIASGAVGTTELAGISITTAKINNGAVTTAKINNGAVTGASIANNTIRWNNLSGAKYTLASDSYSGGGGHPANDTNRLVKNSSGRIGIKFVSADSARASLIVPNMRIKIVGNTTVLWAITSNSVHSNNAYYFDVNSNAALPTLDAGNYYEITFLDYSVIGDKIEDNAIDSIHITNGAVTGAKIANDAVDSEHYVDGSIDRVHLAADIVDGTKIADDEIDSEHIVAGAVDAEHLASNSVTTAKINADAVDGTKIADDAIDSEHITDGAVDLAHLSASGTKSASTFLRGDNSWAEIDGYTSEVIYTASSLTTGITYHSTTDRDLDTGKSFTDYDFIMAEVATGTSGAGTSGKTWTGIGDVSYFRAAQGNSLTFTTEVDGGIWWRLQYRDSNTFRFVWGGGLSSGAVSGNSNTRIFRIVGFKFNAGAGGAGAGGLSDGSVTEQHIAGGAVTTGKIADDAVTGAKIANNAIDSDHYTDGSIDKVHLAADIVDGTKIADDAVDSEHIADGAIDAAHMASGVIPRIMAWSYKRQSGSNKVWSWLSISTKTNWQTNGTIFDTEPLKLGSINDLIEFQSSGVAYFGDQDNQGAKPIGLETRILWQYASTKTGTYSNWAVLDNVFIETETKEPGDSNWSDVTDSQKAIIFRSKVTAGGTFDGTQYKDFAYPVMYPMLGSDIVSSANLPSRQWMKFRFQFRQPHQNFEDIESIYASYVMVKFIPANDGA